MGLLKICKLIAFHKMLFAFVVFVFDNCYQMNNPIELESLLMLVLTVNFIYTKPKNLCLCLNVLYLPFSFSFFPKLLAFFRFFLLLAGYALLRLRHWWVIAVRSQLFYFAFKIGHAFYCICLRGWWCGGGCSWSSFFFPLLPLAKITTLVSSAFLIVKVILSEVSCWYWMWVTPTPILVFLLHLFLKWKILGEIQTWGPGQLLPVMAPGTSPDGPVAWRARRRVWMGMYRSMVQPVPMKRFAVLSFLFCNSCWPKGLLATFCPSSPSFLPGWKHGFWILKSCLRRLRNSNVSLCVEWESKLNTLCIPIPTPSWC